MLTEQEFMQKLKPLETYLYRTALAITGNREDARDALQEALLSAYVSRGQLRDTSAFKPWLKKIVVRQCAKIIAARGRFSLLGNDTDQLVEKAGGEQVHEAVLTRAVVEQLPRPLAQVIALRYLADLKQREIAALLQIPEGTVKSRLNRALEILRKTMAEQKEDHDREMYRS